MLAGALFAFAQQQGDASPAQQPDASANQNDRAAPPPQDSKDEKQETKQTTGTMTGTVNATVDTMRRLPAQWFLGSYVPANENLTPLTLTQRRDVYVRQTYLTGASYLKRLFGAGIDQARGAPYEWGGGFEGYAKRFGSHYGEFIIQNTIAAATDAALGYEPRYDYCHCTGFWERTRHAIGRNFYTYDHTEFERRPQIGLYVGAFAAGAIASEAWRPERENAWKAGAYNAAAQAGYGVLSNWLQEFALDIGHKLSPKNRRHGAGSPEKPDYDAGR